MLFEHPVIAPFCTEGDSAADLAAAPAVPPRALPEQRTFLLPRAIWSMMFLSYAIFFICITLATGRDTGALFAIVISIGYTVMYFGTAAAINGLSGQRPVAAGQPIDTLTGPLSYGAACAQILTVPFLLALFGAAIAIIRANVG